MGVSNWQLFGEVARGDGNSIVILDIKVYFRDSFGLESGGEGSMAFDSGVF